MTVPFAKPPTDARVNQGHWAARGLVGCWLFNEGRGNKACDYSGRGNHGTLGGTALPTWVTTYGGGLSFGGASGYVDCGSNSSLDDLAAWSVYGRIRPTSYGEGFAGRIIDKSGGSGFRRIATNDSTNHELRLEVETTAVTWISSPLTTWLENTWVTFIYTFSVAGDLVTLYSKLDTAGTVSRATTTVGAGNVVSEAAGNFYIGNNSGQTNTFNGIIRELWHWDRVLSDAEALAMFRCPYEVFERRRVAYFVAGGVTYDLPSDAATFTSTGVAAALQAIRSLSCAPGTFALTGQPAALTASHTALAADTGVFALAGIAATLLYNHVLVGAVGTFTHTGIAATLTYSGASSILVGLVAAWPLDEANGNFLDAHGSNDLTETGGTIASTTGLVSNARDFEDGDTEWGEIASNADLRSDGGSITIAGWVWAETLNGSSGFPVIANKGWKSATDANSEWALFGQSGALTFSVADGSTPTGIVSAGTMSTGTWHHVVGRLDLENNTLDVFLDGVKTSQAYTAGINSGTETFELGASSRQSLYWDGLLDEFLFFKRAITDDEVAFLRNGGVGRSYAELAGASEYVIEGDAGTFSLTGIAASFVSERLLSSGPGTFTLTGQTAALIKAIPLISSVGTFVLSGVAAVFEHLRRLTAALGTFLLSGQTATLTTNSTLFDDFNGTAGDLTAHTSDSGHTWANINGTANLTGNGSVEPGSTSTECMTESSWVPTSPNYAITITWGVSSSISNSTLGAFARKTGGLWGSCSLYFWQWYSGTLSIYKLGLGNSFTLLNSTTLTPVDGDEFEFSVSGSSPDAVSLILKQNGTTVLSATDSSSPLYSAGSCGIRTYQENAISTSTGHKILEVSAVESAGTALAAPSYISRVLANGDAEIAWDTRSAAEQYNIYKASSSGGSFSLLTSVLQADPHYYTDTVYVNGNVYKIAAENAVDGEGEQSAEFEPEVFLDSDVDPATIEDSGTQHHGLLTDGRLAIPGNMTWSQKTLGAAEIGPHSQVELLDDVLAPAETQTAGTIWKHSVAFPGPTFNVEVHFDSSGDFRVGYFTDSTHGVFARYDSVAEELDVYGVNGAGETEIMAPVAITLTGPFKITMEVANSVYCVLVDTGSGWTLVGQAEAVTSGSVYDLRETASLAAWRGGAIFDAAADITRRRLSAFSGTNMLREQTLVRWKDQTPYRLPSGNCILGADRCGHVHDAGAGNATLSVCFSLHEYDPVAGEIVGGSFAIINMVDSSGQTISTSDTEVMYDEDTDEFIVWANDWTNWQPASFPSSVAFYVQRIPRSQMVGFVTLNSPTLVTLPAAFTEDFYGPAAGFWNGRYYLAGSSYTGGNNQWLTVFSGTSEDYFDTLVAQDTTPARKSEGYCFLPLGHTLKIIGGDIWNSTWVVYQWDFSDLETLTFEGTIDMPANVGGQTVAHQLAICSYPNPADDTQSIPQIISYTGPPYDYPFDGGKLWVLEPDVFLDGWQLPLRTIGDSTHSVTAETGAFTLTGAAASLEVGRKTSAETGSFDATGIAALFDVERLLVCSSGVFLLTGNTATLVGGPAVLAETGSFSHTGVQAGLFYGRAIQFNTGTFSQSGVAAAFDWDHALTSSPGTYVHSGIAAGFLTDVVKYHRLRGRLDFEPRLRAAVTVAAERRH